MAGKKQFHDSLIEYTKSHLERGDVKAALETAQNSDDVLMLRVEAFKQATQLSPMTDVFFLNLIATGKKDWSLLESPIYIVNEDEGVIWPVKDPHLFYGITKAGEQLAGPRGISIIVKPGSTVTDIIKYLQENTKTIDEHLKSTNAPRGNKKRTPLRNAARDAAIYSKSQQPDFTTAQKLSEELDADDPLYGDGSAVRTIINRESKRHKANK